MVLLSWFKLLGGPGRPPEILCLGRHICCPAVPLATLPACALFVSQASPHWLSLLCLFSCSYSSSQLEVNGLGRPLPSAQVGTLSRMAVKLELPGDIYYDALESYMLTAQLTELMRWQQAVIPAALSLTARNDIFRYARTLLRPELYQLFSRYSEQYSRLVPCPMPAVLPPPDDLASERPSLAEQHAWMHLQTGGGSLWEAVRQTVALLDFEAPRQVMMKQHRQARSFHLGVCARGPLIGICKATPLHHNVCRLLTCLVKHVHPEHSFTSLAVNVNYFAPPHKDTQNGPQHNLIISLSQQDHGGLWVEDPQGKIYLEHQGELRRGEHFSLLDHALLFPAHRNLHASYPERSAPLASELDRFTLIAYTVRNWTSLRAPMRTRLQAVGFDLPEDDGPSQSSLPPMLLPTVLI
ncbi:unnamed protein product [Symbiodinium sp. CCMP2592]|nr:unnamed protein product [Symbiodinium sp. CCMP2592]